MALYAGPGGRGAGWIVVRACPCCPGNNDPRPVVHTLSPYFRTSMTTLSWYPDRVETGLILYLDYHLLLLTPAVPGSWGSQGYGEENEAYRHAYVETRRFHFVPGLPHV